MPSLHCVGSTPLKFSPLPNAGRETAKLYIKYFVKNFMYWEVGIWFQQLLSCSDKDVRNNYETFKKFLAPFKMVSKKWVWFWIVEWFVQFCRRIMHNQVSILMLKNGCLLTGAMLHSHNYALQNNSLKSGGGTCFICESSPYDWRCKDLWLQWVPCPLLASYFAARNWASAILRLSGTVCLCKMTR